MTEPWGHKITFVVYVEGNEQEAIERVLDETIFPGVKGLNFIGSTVEPVKDEPQDQGSS
jgi:hypothetical protein